MVRPRIVQDINKDTKDFVDNISKCESCVMKAICTLDEIKQKGITDKCPDSIYFDLTDEEKVNVAKGMENMGFAPEKESVDMIPVIKMEYWDGSKFIIRTDKARYKKILCRLRVKMRSKFLALSLDEQREIGYSQTMLKRTEENMSEEAYLKIKEG